MWVANTSCLEIIFSVRSTSGKQKTSPLDCIRKYKQTNKQTNIQIHCVYVELLKYSERACDGTSDKQIRM